MWWPNPKFGAPRLSRRRFLLSAAGAAGASVWLPSNWFPGAAHAQTPTWLASEHPAFSVGATVGDLTFVAQDAAGPGALPTGTVPQTERTLENLRRALQAVGQSLDDLVFVHVLLTDYAEATAVARLLQAAFRSDRAPTTCFIGVSKLGPGRLVRMDAVASTNPDRAQIVAPGLPLPLGAHCHAVRVGDLVFVGAVDAPETAPESTPPSAIILDHMDTVLRAAGLSLKDSFRHWAFVRNLAATSVQRDYGRGRNMRLDPILAPNEFPANSRMGTPALGAGVAHRSYALATRGSRQYVESNFARKVPRVFAQSVRVGDWLFIARQDAVDVANRTLFVGDLRSQTEQCVRQLQLALSQ